MYGPLLLAGLTSVRDLLLLCNALFLVKVDHLPRQARDKQKPTNSKPLSPAAVLFVVGGGAGASPAVR